MAGFEKTEAMAAQPPKQREKIEADVCIIGAGSGGLVTAYGTANLGLKTVLFEKGEMGGDCLNYGCVPSKALIAAGKAAQRFRDGTRYGIAAADPQIEWAKVRGHVHGVIETIAPVDSQERYEGFGVRVIREHARFADPNTVVSASVEVKARRFVIATGSGPFVPPIPGLDSVPYLTNETVFNLDVLPESLIVLGAGPIGMELGQSFQRLGSKVTIVEAAKALGRSEPEAAKIVIEAMTHEGVELLEGWKAVKVARAGDRIIVSLQDGSGQMREAQGTHLLVAVGRRAHVHGLDLEKAGVEYDNRGVKTGANLRTSNPKVWAVGDAAGKEQFTHAAGWHGSVFVRRAIFKQGSRADSLPIPHVTYTEPEIAGIGLTEAEGRRIHGDALRITEWKFHENDRAIAERAKEGFMKLVLSPKGVILGATIVGEGAGDIIQMVGLAMSNKLKVGQLYNFISPYPTRAEIVKRAAGAWYTPVVFTPTMKTLAGVLSKLP